MFSNKIQIFKTLSFHFKKAERFIFLLENPAGKEQHSPARSLPQGAPIPQNTGESIKITGRM